MDSFAFLPYLYSSLVALFEPINLGIMFLGISVGIVGGMLPGISIVTTLALFIPFTFSMPAATALIALGAIYAGASYGGANAAILINTPGQPGSIATTLDGYAMTRNGRAQEALYVALTASTYGGIIGGILLLLFFEPLSSMALKFGSEAFFWMAIFGLTTLAAMSPGNVTKSLLGGVIGLALSTIGMDPSDGFPRFTFDIYELTQGLDMVVLMTALFSFSQMLLLLESSDGYIAPLSRAPGAFMTAVRDLWNCKMIVTISSVLGTFIGGLPGAGGSVASIITYNEAKRWDKHPERFGTGVPEGVAVPESANNACVGGALVPLMALGIPGSAAAAILMGGLLSQGLTPGPQLLEKNADIAYTFIISIILVNVVMLAVGYVMVKLCARILDVPKTVIIPSVITLSILGAFSLRSSLFDVLVLLITGGVSYLCLKAKISPAAIALGVVLGPIVEENLGTTMMRSLSSSLPELLLFSPMSMLFIALSLISLLVPVFLRYRKCGHAAPRMVFNAANLRRFDFWMILVFTVAAGFFIVQSLQLKGVGRVFPLVTFGLIVGLGLLVMGMLCFEPVPAKDTTNYRDVLLYFLMSMVAFLGISLFGFYTDMFLCMLVMTAYGYFVMRRETFTLLRAGQLTLLCLVITGVEYVCFSLLLHVPTPTGLGV